MHELTLSGIGMLAATSNFCLDFFFRLLWIEMRQLFTDGGGVYLRYHHDDDDYYKEDD